jgi:hypothetical protein
MVFAGCSTVKIEMNGRPAPNYIRQTHVLGLDIGMEQAFAYYYQQPEGNEYLDTWQYLLAGPQTIVIKEKRLESVKLMCNLFNPKKSKYSFRILHKTYDKANKLLSTSNEILYEGALSSKMVVEELPLKPDVIHEISVAVYDTKDVVRYLEMMPLRYTVTQVNRKPASVR